MRGGAVFFCFSKMKSVLRRICYQKKKSKLFKTLTFFVADDWFLFIFLYHTVHIDDDITDKKLKTSHAASKHTREWNTFHFSVYLRNCCTFRLFCIFVYTFLCVARSLTSSITTIHPKKKMMILFTNRTFKV